MQVAKRTDYRNGLFSLSMQVMFDEDELALVRRLGLRRVGILTGDGPLTGYHRRPRALAQAHRRHIGRLKGRWSAALVRTHGLHIIDGPTRFAGRIGQLFARVVRPFVGRVRTVASLMNGITVTSPRLADIKEAELFVLLSLAAIGRAIDYGRTLGTEVRYRDRAFMREIDGLDFAGAGDDAADPSRRKWKRDIIVIGLLVAVAAIAALQGLGRELQRTFANVEAEANAVEQPFDPDAFDLNSLDLNALDTDAFDPAVLEPPPGR